jgi:CelD/BcsL family acetyltransferase involved in cellulose biosynthesis
VAGHPRAIAFHHPDWTAMVAKCYRFRAFALATTDPAGEIQAGLPVVEVRHLRGAPKWVSLPFSDYCPPLASAPAQEEQLVTALRQASGAAGVRRVEVRAPLSGADPVPAGGPAALRHLVALDDGPAAVYARFHPSQVKRSIRRAERERLTVRPASGPPDLVDTFYRLHLLTRRRLGVPIQPRRFFRLLWDGPVRTGLASVLIVESGGRPIAAAVFLTWNQTMTYKFGASDASAWVLRPNHLLMWHAMQAACEQGCRWFDFGRTDAAQDGLRSFKLSFGATEEPLAYRTLGAARGPDGEPAAPTEGLAARLLRPVIQHSPLLVCRAVGEALYRYVA